MKITEYVNVEKRTCVVVITDCETDVMQRVKKLTRRANPAGDFMFYGDRSYLNGPFRGIAKCHPADTFVEEFGLELARERAMRVYRRAYNREIMYLMDQLTEIENALQNCIDYTVFNEGELIHEID